MTKKLLILLLMTITLFSNRVFVNAELIPAPDEFTLPASDLWDNYNYYDDIYGMRIEFPYYLPDKFETLTLDIPVTDYVVASNGSVDSTITFIATGNTWVFDLADFNPSIYGLYFFHLSNIQGTDVRSAHTVQINIVQNYTALPTGYVDYWNTNTDIIFNMFPIMFIFFDRLQIYYSEYVYGTPTIPDDPTPPPNTVFVGWRTLSGEIYTFDYIDDYIRNDNGEINLYATYDTMYDVGYVINEPTESAPDEVTNILSVFGFNNSAGYVLLFTFIILVVVIALSLWHIPLFVILIVTIALAGFFMYLGFLPIFYTIVLLMVITVGLIFTFKGGGVYE